MTVVDLAFELRRVRLDLVEAHRAAHGSTHQREVIVVKVTDADGNSGWGECSALAEPTYNSEYLDGCWHMLTSTLIPAIVDAPAADVTMGLQEVVGHRMAKASLITALMDLDLRAGGRSLRSALGDDDPARVRVPARAVIPLGDEPADALPRVAEAIERGFTAVKLKIAPGCDLAVIRVVRSTWPDLAIAADANGSYEDAGFVEDRLGGSRGVAMCNLDYLEQPLPADDLVGSAVLARRLEVPIALDESIESIGDAATALALGAMQQLNVKVARVGGPLAAVVVARMAADQGCEVFCGGMLESGIGRAAALAFAAQKSCTGATDLGPSDRYFGQDLTPSITMENGQVVVPDGPGIGVEPYPERLVAATVECWERQL